MKRFLQRLVFFLVVTLLVVLVACGADPTVLGSTDSGSRFDLDIGEQIVIELESNASTGYAWELAQPDSIPMVELRSSVYTAPETDLVGAAGIQEFTFDAIEFGAGVVRLEYIRNFDEVIIPDKIVEYIVTVGGAPWPPDGPVPPTTSVTAPEPTSTSSMTTSTEPPPAVRVGDLFDGEGARDVVVEGFVVWDAASARLCDVLMESFPPQCGGPWVVIANPDLLTEPLESAQGVRWSQGYTSISGSFDGDRLIVGPDRSVIEPTSEEVALVAAFVAFAQAPNPDTASGVPFAPSVSIGLGPDVLSTVSDVDAGDPNNWWLDVEEYDGYAGPFSALELIKTPVKTGVGQHTRCAGPPVPAPAGFEDARQISIQPQVATSCLEWWTIDLFLTDDGAIEGVTLDLYGP
ncbi:MAG: protease inhibitor I42 family protein [Acidimicrobiales bacterium]